MKTSLGNPLIEKYKEHKNKRRKEFRDILNKSNNIQTYVTIISVIALYLINTWMAELNIDPFVKFLLGFLLPSIPIVFTTGFLLRNKIKQFEKEEDMAIPPTFNFEGEWNMRCCFHTPLINENDKIAPEVRELIMRSFEKRVEVGVTNWKQDEFGVYLHCNKAYAGKIIDTQEADLKDAIKIGGITYVPDEMNTAIVRFRSDLASFDKDSIRWVFTATVDWGKPMIMQHEFKGVEEYQIELDTDGKPR